MSDEKRYYPCDPDKNVSCPKGSCQKECFHTSHIEFMQEIQICKHCGKPEFVGDMHGLNGVCSCRSCYKAQWQDVNHKLYIGTDLDGPRPTMEDYKAQEEFNKEDNLC